MGGLTLVVSPLIAFSYEQIIAMRKLVIRVLSLNAGTSNDVAVECVGYDLCRG